MHFFINNVISHVLNPPDCRGGPMCPPNVGTTYFHRFSLCGTPFGVGQTHGSAPTGGGLVTSETLTFAGDYRYCSKFKMLKSII